MMNLEINVVPEPEWSSESSTPEVIRAPFTQTGRAIDLRGSELEQASAGLGAQRSQQSDDNPGGVAAGLLSRVYGC